MKDVIDIHKVPSKLWEVQLAISDIKSDLYNFNHLNIIVIILIGVFLGHFRGMRPGVLREAAVLYLS